jgi:lysophospholipase L1-like esterase
MGGSSASSTGAGGTGTGGSAGRSGAGGGSPAAGAGGSAGSGGMGGGGRGGSTGTGGAGSGGTMAFNPCPAAGTACAIMPLGDSITEGCCTAPMGGYRIEMFHQALTNKKNITFVGTLSNGPNTVDNQTFPKRHEGHGGYTISQIAGLADNAISSSRPHIVLLKIGTNDINGNMDVANAPNRLASLIDQITKDAPSALLVVSTIIPTTNDGTNQRVQTYNAAIKGKVDSAAAAGKHVIYIDNYTPFAQTANWKTALMADGLHPNSAGYVVLGQSFYKLISALLPAAQ